MTRASHIRVVILTVTLAGLGCSVDADLTDKECPCAEGWFCDTRTSRCVQEVVDPTMDAGRVDAAERDVGVPIDVPGRVVFTDDSESTFGAGTFDATVLEGDSVTLEDGMRSGELVSRVFDAGGERDWTSLAWTPRGPYGRNLPDTRAAESGYTTGAVDMAGNLLLLHLDQTEDLGDGAAIVDTSGRSNDAFVLNPGGPVRSVAGVIGNAIADRRDTYVFVPLTTTDDFDFGMSNVTWSIWVNSTEDCTDRNKVHLGIDGVGSTRTHLWLGCTRSDNSSCPPGDVGGRAAGTWRSIHNAADGGNFCSSTVINDGQWHHLLIVKEDHNPGVLRLFVDGVMEDENPTAFMGPLQFPMNPDLTVGDFTGGTYPAIGNFDEVAIWNRALGSEEVTAIYRRGALKLSIQVRTCDEPTCSGRPFVGPDGTSDTSFTDTSGAVEPTTTFALTDLRGRYMQYRARFESLSATQRPTLDRVTLIGDTF